RTPARGTPVFMSPAQMEERDTGVMVEHAKPIEFVIPPSTSPVVLPSSWQPAFTRVNSNFTRVAYDPSKCSLVTERIDRKDTPREFNYNLYPLSRTTAGAYLSTPRPTPASFIAHHSSSPSTWFDSLPVAQLTPIGQAVLATA